MQTTEIAALLAPFAGELPPEQLEQISKYIDILLKWNDKTNLTAVRDPREMVVRHFGESLFAARALLEPESALDVIDVGSGAGFPGMPLKLFAPRIRLTLVEAQAKKATFLKEVVRALGFGNVTVLSARAETLTEQADLVTLRAVERFDEVLPIAGHLVKPGGRLALLIGTGQIGAAHQLPEFAWQEASKVPQSRTRVLLVGNLEQ
ncbi:MAG: 16S rRNA (guanine(527)-N(7))-methyltransferase RsmG [Candidatus Koribacter versatilis]|uniref:Ribosomal RNA small subunit methyltransferase G n=1 Tax=Candidatus Korobacter versatilis TaxID=658062 RepID=A0A932A7T4_9BACT|nr:16S rRNA (guanine(527)-N(7))-methyltransferase RsmG [Candidatus Koribacter versatilis]